MRGGDDMSADFVGLVRKGRVPDLERRRLAVVAKDVQCRSIEQEVLAIACRKINPSRGKNTEDMTVCEEGNASFRRSDLGENAIGARASLLR